MMEHAKFSERHARNQSTAALILAKADRRCATALRGGSFEDSSEAQKPEPRFRGQTPDRYGPCSSLLQG